MTILILFRAVISNRYRKAYKKFSQLWNLFFHHTKVFNPLISKRNALDPLKLPFSVFTFYLYDAILRINRRRLIAARRTQREIKKIDEITSKRPWAGNSIVGFFV